MEDLTRFNPTNCPGSMTHRLSRYCSVLLSAAILLCGVRSVNADEHDEEKARTTTERFLKVLLANPRYGTAFDRVYSFHMDRGSIRTLQTSLQKAAKLPLDPDADLAGTADETAIAMPEDADPANASLLLGLIELKHSESDAAIVVLQNAAALDPDNAMAHWSLARAFSMAHRTDEAVASLEQALKCEPAKQDLLEIYKELARNLHRAQKPAEALQVWQRLEAEFPGDLRVREQIAATLAEDGRWDESLTRYLALAQDSKIADQRVQANLAASDVMLQLGRSQDAIQLLEKQLARLDSDSWLFKEIRRRIESVFRNEKDLPGLVAYYDGWIKTHPEDVDAMSRLARTLTLQDRSLEALDLYRKAILLAPSNVSLREALISLLVRDAKVADAIIQYEEMSKFDADNRDHIEAWGLLYLSLKDVPLAERQQQAASVWERLLAGREEDPVTLARLAGLLRRADLPDRAIALYQSAIDKAPNEPQYREYLGEYLHRLQRPDEAVVAWNEMGTGSRRTKENLIRLAEVLNQFNQIEPALASMREACGLSPDPLERVQFAEMLRTGRAAGREPSVSSHNTDTENTNAVAESHSEGSRPPLAEDILFTEAFEQLDLADQSAETPDERQQILKERIQCLIAAGQLEQQIRQLATELNAGTNVTAERWRTLAMFQDAAEKTNEATASAAKVVELQPDSILGWTLLADLYERTGRLGDAAAALQKLASLDRRGISEYLRRSAKLQVRLGQFDAALATGRDVIKATPGNPEAYQFFADLAFEVGQPKIAVDALRQAVRVNPGDEVSLKALAKTLADEFQTPEAIELYWRAFEKAPDLESQTQIVIALSNLYLRSNQFPKLIGRLELRSRELNLPTEMTRCIATAYREAGDFRKARETLLSAAEGTDTDVGILRQLVQLSLQEQNEVEAIDYQRRIVAQTSGDSERKHLAEMLLAAGQSEDGYHVFESTADATVTDAMLLAEIQLGGSGRNIASVIKACREYLESTPNDWSVLASLATLLQQTDQREEASHLALQVLGMTVAPEAIGSLNTLPVIDARSSSIQRHTNYLTTYHAVPKNTFVAAYCRCADILLLTAGTPHADAMPQIFKAESRARLGDLPLVFIADNLPPTSQAIDLFLNHMKNETESQNLTDDQRLLLQLVVTELRIRFHRIATEDLSHERAEFVRRLPTQVGTHPEFFDRNQILDRVWSIFESDTIATKQLLTALRESLKAVTEDRSRAVVAAIAMAFEDAPLLVAAAETVIPTPMQESEDGFWESLTRIWRLAGLLEKRMITSPLKDSELLATQASLVCRFSKLPSRNLTELLNDASAMGISSWRSILFSESDNVMEHSLFLLSVNEKTGRALTEWAEKNLADPDPLFRARAHLLLPSENSNEQAVLHLIQAAEAMPDVPGLRFACALEAARLNLLDEAVQLLDSMQVSDPASKVEIEIKALDWSLAGGNKSRAIVAAETLFGLPLNVDQQKSLAARYSQLGLTGKFSALQARLGRGSETRQSVLAQQLQSYLAQSNNELAGEVAWELLKLASGGTLFSGHRPNDDRDDGGERLQAIKALGKLKRLQPLIDRYEAMLEASPESVDLLEILCEFHEAAEQFPQLAEKRDRIALLSKKAPPSLKAKAVALENSGDVSGACDIYLQILKGDPEAFADEMETYVQAFERAKRHADFLTAVLRIDPALWSDNAALLINIAAELARAKTNDAVVKECVEAMLANEDTRRLAIGGFLARPDVVAEETLLPAIQDELTSEDAFEDLIRCNETFLILQGVKQEASLKSLHEFLTSRRAAGRQPSVSTPPSTLVPSEKESETEGSPPPLAEMQTDLMLIFLDARLGERAAVEQRVKLLLFVDAVTPAPSSGLAASVGDSTRQRRENGSPGGEKGGGEVAFGVLVLNTRLKDLGKEWDNVRLALLESLAAKIAAQDAEKQNELADSVLDELGSVYESLGQTQKARSILNQRIQTMLVSTGADNGKASESIRQLLQAGEKIQHSGFPIEGARLLLNVTPHDIDEFTSDLDDDKAIAFKSRFNASQRWARQQITPEKIVTWFEMSVSDLTGDSSGTDPESTDILLEVSGVTDPRTSDKDALQRLTIESLLLNSIRKSEFTDPDLIKRTDAAVSQLVVIEQLNLPLLTVALAFSDRMSLTDRDALNERIAAAANIPVIITESNPADRKSSRLPEALRSDPDLSCMQTARLLATQADRQPLVTHLLNRSAAAAARCNSRLLKIAVLNECVAVAKLAGLKDQVSQLELAAQAAIEVQLQSASPGGIDGDIDLAHEIRTRLLNKK